MSATSFYERQRQRAEDAVIARLPAKDKRPAILNEAICYAALTGGKRLRPVLSLTAFDIVRNADGCEEAAENAAVAIELLHTYTLIHDDLPSMDNDVLRRGQPTVHVKFGEANAILAGDALQAYAFEIAARPTSLSPERTIHILRELAVAAGPAGVVAGQVEDVDEPGSATEERLAYVHQHKTADFFRTALRIGAIAGGGDAAQIRALSDFGNSLGIAFQIIDDLLDAPEGQPVPDELTCLRLWSYPKARSEASRYTEMAISSLSVLPDSEEKSELTALAETMLNRVI